MTSKRKPRIGKLLSIGDCRHEMGRVYRSARREQLDTLDAVRLARILHMMISAFIDTELEQRISQLEAQHEQHRTF